MEDVSSSELNEIISSTGSKVPSEPSLVKQQTSATNTDPDYCHKCSNLNFFNPYMAYPMSPEDLTSERFQNMQGVPSRQGFNNTSCQIPFGQSGMQPGMQYAFPCPMFVPVYYPPPFMMPMNPKYSASTQTIPVVENTSGTVVNEVHIRQNFESMTSSEPNLIHQVTKTAISSKSSGASDLNGDGVISEDLGQIQNGDTKCENGSKLKPTYSNRMCGDSYQSPKEQKENEQKREPRFSVKPHRKIDNGQHGSKKMINDILAPNEQLVESSANSKMNDDLQDDSVGDFYSNQSDDDYELSDNTENEDDRATAEQDLHRPNRPPIRIEPPNFHPPGERPFSSNGGRNIPEPPNPQTAMLMLNLLTSNRTSAGTALPSGPASRNNLTGLFSSMSPAKPNKSETHPFCQPPMETQPEISNFQRTARFREPASMERQLGPRKDGPRPNPFQPPGLQQHGHVHKVPTALCNDLHNDAMKLPSPPGVKHVRMHGRNKD